MPFSVYTGPDGMVLVEISGENECGVLGVG